MNHITIECPDCHKEHTTPLQGGQQAMGGFNCDCGTIIHWQVSYTGAWWERHKPKTIGELDDA